MLESVSKTGIGANSYSSLALSKVKKKKNNLSLSATLQLTIKNSIIVI